jgi:NAD(P)-dependent dehydrogenase (short-subunit alcohol dehydrogenase family)
MRALKQECAKLNISVCVVAPAITITPILSSSNRDNSQTPEQHAKTMASHGVPLNKPESIALAVCWLLNEEMAANGAGIFIQADKFLDLERGLAKSREQWMGREMLDLFRGGRKAPLFVRLDSENPSKPKI